MVLFFYLLFINPQEEEILDLLQEVENDVLHAVDDNGRLIPRGPAVIFLLIIFVTLKGKKFNEKLTKVIFAKIKLFHKNHKSFSKL